MERLILGKTILEKRLKRLGFYFFFFVIMFIICFLASLLLQLIGNIFVSLGFGAGARITFESEERPTFWKGAGWFIVSLAVLEAATLLCMTSFNIGFQPFSQAIIIGGSSASAALFIIGWIATGCR